MKYCGSRNIISKFLNFCEDFKYFQLKQEESKETVQTYKNSTH